MKRRLISFVSLLCLSVALFLMGCSSSNAAPSKEEEDSSATSSSNASKEESSDDTGTADEPAGPKRDSTPQVLVPSADGVEVQESDVALIDSSNKSNGYFMIEYRGSSEKVKMTVIGPDGKQYTYLISGFSGLQVYPLTAGNGPYVITVLEVVDVALDQYAIAFSAEIDAQLTDEFLPALYPNQYVNFNADTNAVAKAAEVVANASTELDVVQDVYTFVIENVSYDKVKAQTVQYGYLPVIDETLETGMGICFDYAALTACMLRTQGIPTRLEVGYSGQAYHAWISTYITDIGWIDGIIEFNGEGWTLLDPTLGASNDKAGVEAYIGSGTQYITEFIY